MYSYQSFVHWIYKALNQGHCCYVVSTVNHQVFTQKAGLPLTADKTKYAFEYHNLNAGQNRNVKLANKSCKNVAAGAKITFMRKICNLKFVLSLQSSST